jgi:uncharacterized membrane protein
MNYTKIAKFFLLLIAIPTLLVGIGGLLDPQSIMDNVGQTLQTISAKSSTRAIYGGMHFFFALFFIYGAFKAQREALIILALYGSGFVIGRLVSLSADGTPNEFISNFIIVEVLSAAISIWLYIKMSSTQKKQQH